MGGDEARQQAMKSRNEGRPGPAPAQRAPLQGRNLVEVQFRIGWASLRTTVAEGARFLDALKKAVDENGGKMVLKWHPGLRAHEIVYLEMKGVALAKTMEEGIHFFLGKAGIPMVAGRDGSVGFPNGMETEVGRGANIFTIGLEKSNANPADIRDLEGMYARGGGLKISEGARTAIAASHGASRNGEISRGGKVLVLDKDTGRLFSISEFLIEEKEGFRAPQFPTQEFGMVGLVLPTERGKMLFPMDGSAMRIPYLFIKLFDGRIEDEVEVRYNPLPCGRESVAQEWAPKAILPGEKERIPRTEACGAEVGAPGRFTGAEGDKLRPPEAGGAGFRPKERVQKPKEFKPDGLRGAKPAPKNKFSAHMETDLEEKGKGPEKMDFAGINKAWMLPRAGALGGPVLRRRAERGADAAFEKRKKRSKKEKPGLRGSKLQKGKREKVLLGEILKKFRKAALPKGMGRGKRKRNLDSREKQEPAEKMQRGKKKKGHMRGERAGNPARRVLGESAPEKRKGRRIARARQKPKRKIAHSLLLRMLGVYGKRGKRRRGKRAPFP